MVGSSSEYCFFYIVVTKHTVFRTTLLEGHFPVLDDAVASQLIKNGKYEALDSKPSWLVAQKVSVLWKTTTLDPVNTSKICGFYQVHNCTNKSGIVHHARQTQTHCPTLNSILNSH